jgi:hypothetical protein
MVHNRDDEGEGQGEEQTFDEERTKENTLKTRQGNSLYSHLGVERGKRFTILMKKEDLVSVVLRLVGTSLAQVEVVCLHL